MNRRGLCGSCFGDPGTPLKVSNVPVSAQRGSSSALCEPRRPRGLGGGRGSVLHSPWRGAGIAVLVLGEKPLSLIYSPLTSSRAGRAACAAAGRGSCAANVYRVISENARCLTRVMRKESLAVV